MRFTRTCTVPLPVPLLPDVIARNEPPVVTEAVQVQWLAVLTVNVTVVAESLTGMTSGVTVKEHAAAAWVTTNDWPAIVSVAVREAPVFAWTASVTDPLPVPLPPVTVIHVGAPVVVQLHAEVVVTATGVEPPAAVGLALVGLML